MYGKINFAAQFKDDMALQGSFQFQVDLEFFQGKWEGGEKGLFREKGLVKNLRFRSEENVYILEVKESWFCNFNFVRVSFKCSVDNRIFFHFRAEELFAEAIKASVVNLGVSRTHSFVPGQKSDTPHEDEVVHAQPMEENNKSQEQDQTQRGILPLTPQSMISSPSIPDNSFKKVNKRILIELMKGNFLGNLAQSLETSLSKRETNCNFL